MVFPTASGETIKHENFLKVESQFDGCTCCSTLPNVEFPI